MADDEIVRERVRSALGRVCSHAGAIEVSVSNGTVVLAGPVLEREHARVVHAMQRVRGVREVEDHLERHTHTAGIPGLQESRNRSFASEMRAVHCSDLMKHEVQTVSEADTVHRAAELMALTNVGFLPVCDRERKVIGTITDRDIAVRVVAQERSPVKCRVGEVMTSPVVGCRPDDEVTLAEQLMGQHQVSRLVITEVDGIVQGVVSLSDIAEREPARRAVRTLRAVAAREAPRL
jgi:CBS domain-containing protein